MMSGRRVCGAGEEACSRTVQVLKGCGRGYLYRVACCVGLFVEMVLGVDGGS